MMIDVEWWRGAVIYQVYPRSFHDADGNGVGDLRGITNKLDYIAALNVDAIWISPFFPSPMADFGYDVSDYCGVDPLFGTLADADALIAGAHARGLKLLIDLVISHSSDQHPWFIESRRDRQNPKADWYVWADAQPDGTPPNNWLSIFGGSAWEWDARRRQYYLHNFLKSQPDLNFHNPEVQVAVLDAAQFWLDRGVDGFRLDTVNFYFHDQALRANPPAPADTTVNTVPRSNPYGYQLHLYDKTRPENLAFLEKLRALLDRYPGTTAVGELGIDSDVPATTAAYTEAGKRLHMVYGFDLLAPKLTAADIRRAVETMEAGIGSGWISWALSNHDFPRVISRWGYADVATQAAPMLVALATALRGSPCLYQGEELGLTEAEVPFERLQDPYGKTFWPEFKGRDGCRTPMPWAAQAPFGGFSEVEPWLPIPADHAAAAADRQAADPSAPLNRIRHFLGWRREQPSLRNGSIHFFDAPPTVLLFQRGADRLCAINLGRGAVTVPLPTDGRLLPESGFSAELSGRSLTLPPLGAAFLAVS
jgi:alpha-glucosidase